MSDNEVSAENTVSQAADAAPEAASTDTAPETANAGATAAATDAKPAKQYPTKQPKGLFWLFGAEAWERFSYYGMRAILVLFLVNQLDFSRENALALYGVYTGLVYLTPLLGGFLSDRILGARKAIIIGGCTMALGEMCLAFPELLYTGLALLILGNGFFKPNISNIVGGLYEEGDPRRDGGFTIFYMGINLGAFFSPLVCGTLGQMFGWKYGFIAAGFGMIIGQLVFNIGQKHYGNAGYPPDMGVVPAGTRLRGKDIADIFIYIGGIIGIVWLADVIWKNVCPSLSQPLVIGVIIFILATIVLGFIYKGTAQAKEETKTEDSSDEKMVMGFSVSEWQRIAVILIMTFFVIFFWMGFEQAGGTMTLFADQNTDRNLFGWEIPSSWFQSINPFVIVAFAPLFSMLWFHWDQSKYRLSTPLKMALGLFMLGLGFVIMFTASKIAANGTLVGPLWLTSVYFVHTMGELCLSPVGLSMVSKLAPQRLMSVMMGFWFLSSAVANYMAGKLEAFLNTYQINMWYFLIISSICASVALVALNPILKKWMHGRA
ncbi:MAG: peptide MFS transporter [bacterium]|nr:peptide MFS transporter [bacterium]